MFHTRDRDVIDTSIFTLLQEELIYLAYIGKCKFHVFISRRQNARTAAKNVFSDLFRSDEVLRVGIGDVTLEVGVSNHLRQLGAGFRMT